jgi:hypothetical protein
LGNRIATLTVTSGSSSSQSIALSGIGIAPVTVTPTQPDICQHARGCDERSENRNSDKSS